jgi:hypothetical protein
VRHHTLSDLLAVRSFMVQGNRSNWPQ